MQRANVLLNCWNVRIKSQEDIQVYVLGQRDLADKKVLGLMLKGQFSFQFFIFQLLYSMLSGWKKITFDGAFESKLI